MIDINFALDETADPSGFDIGDIQLKGEQGAVDLNSMVVVSAALLMDQLQQWYEAVDHLLEFNAVDSRVFIKIVQEGENVKIWYMGSCIGTADTRRFLSRVMQACLRLQKDFVDKLDREDVGRRNFEETIVDFRDFLRRAGVVFLE